MIPKEVAAEPYGHGAADAPATKAVDMEQLAGVHELRSLLHGDLSAAAPLTRKVLAVARGRLHLRRCTQVGRFVQLEGHPLVVNRGVMTIGHRVIIHSRTVRCEFVTHRQGQLEIGDRTYINYGCSLSAHKLVRIGSGCHLGPYVNILDNEYHSLDDHSHTPESRPVIIGDNVWIGTRVIILPGITIGDNAVIGAGAVVTKDVPARSIAAGNPARIIRTL